MKVITQRIKAISFDTEHEIKILEAIERLLGKSSTNDHRARGLTDEQASLCDEMYELLHSAGIDGSED